MTRTTPDRSDVLAVFTMRDGRVSAEYSSDYFRDEVEKIGVLSSSGKKLTVEDGEEFYKALDYAWANSSFIHVE